MSKLYFKDATGEFRPIDISYLDLRPNALAILQIQKTDNKEVSCDELQSIADALKSIVPADRGSMDFLVITHKIKIDVLNRDKDLMNKEILIDLSQINNREEKQQIKESFRDALKGIHHEYVRLPIKVTGGNA